MNQKNFPEEQEKFPKEIFVPNLPNPKNSKGIFGPIEPKAQSGGKFGNFNCSVIEITEHELIIKLEIPKDIADTCCKSIGIETKNRLNRSKIDLNYNGGLKIRIKSKDLHALRAALNTYLRWVIMCCHLLSKKNGTNS